MGTTAAVSGLAFLLRHLASDSGDAPRAASAVPPTGKAIRDLAILAQLQNDGLNPDNNASGSIAVHDPLAAKAFPNLLKLPGLFGDIKLTPSMPRP
jgi:hypothetical protein